MNLIPATSPEQIDTLIAQSMKIPVVLLKHSTRCGISSVVLDRLRRQWNDNDHPEVMVAIIDVIASRDVSTYVAEQLGVRHESPQALLVWQGRPAYHTSHMGINFAELSAKIQALAV